MKPGQLWRLCLYTVALDSEKASALVSKLKSALSLRVPAFKEQKSVFCKSQLQQFLSFFSIGPLYVSQL